MCAQGHTLRREAGGDRLGQSVQNPHAWAGEALALTAWGGAGEGRQKLHV